MFADTREEQITIQAKIQVSMSYFFRPNCMKVILVGVFLQVFQVSISQGWADVDAAVTAGSANLGNENVVMIWKAGDTLVYKKESGGFSTKTAVPIASASKWLTAALVMMFVDEGKINLDDKIGRWVPEFDRQGKAYITVRHCLAHLTGIEDEGKLLKKLFQRRKFENLEDEVNSLASREIRANAGEDFWYGGVGINIAGRVLEVVSKKKFDALIRQRLLNPLGMRKTSFANMEGGPVNPSGGAVSTAEDYMKFLVMLLNKGKHNGVQLLSEKSVEELMRVQAKPSMIRYAPESAKGFGYALGSWVLEEGIDRKAKVVASPGLMGTWPMIDWCRGYAYLVVAKKLPGEERTEAHLRIKEAVDGHFESVCR